MSLQSNSLARNQQAMKMAQGGGQTQSERATFDDIMKSFPNSNSMQSGSNPQQQAMGLLQAWDWAHKRREASRRENAYNTANKDGTSNAYNNPYNFGTADGGVSQDLGYDANGNIVPMYQGGAPTISVSGGNTTMPTPTANNTISVSGNTQPATDNTIGASGGNLTNGNSFGNLFGNNNNGISINGGGTNLSNLLDKTGYNYGNFSNPVSDQQSLTVNGALPEEVNTISNSISPELKQANAEAQQQRQSTLASVMEQQVQSEAQQEQQQAMAQDTPQSRAIAQGYESPYPNSFREAVDRRRELKQNLANQGFSTSMDDILARENNGAGVEQPQATGQTNSPYTYAISGNPNGALTPESNTLIDKAFNQQPIQTEDTQFSQLANQPVAQNSQNTATPTQSQPVQEQAPQQVQVNAQGTTQPQNANSNTYKTSLGDNVTPVSYGSGISISPDSITDNPNKKLLSFEQYNQKLMDAGITDPKVRQALINDNWRPLEEARHANILESAMRTFMDEKATPEQKTQALASIAIEQHNPFLPEQYKMMVDEFNDKMLNSQNERDYRNNMALAARDRASRTGGTGGGAGNSNLVKAMLNREGEDGTVDHDGEHSDCMGVINDTIRDMGIEWTDSRRTDDTYNYAEQRGLWDKGATNATVGDIVIGDAGSGEADGHAAVYLGNGRYMHVAASNGKKITNSGNPFNSVYGIIRTSRIGKGGKIPSGGKGGGKNSPDFINLNNALNNYSDSIDKVTQNISDNKEKGTAIDNDLVTSRDKSLENAAKQIQNYIRKNPQVTPAQMYDMLNQSDNGLDVTGLSDVVAQAYGGLGWNRNKLARDLINYAYNGNGQLGVNDQQPNNQQSDNSPSLTKVMMNFDWADTPDESKYTGFMNDYKYMIQHKDNFGFGSGDDVRASVAKEIEAHYLNKPNGTKIANDLIAKIYGAEPRGEGIRKVTENNDKVINALDDTITFPDPDNDIDSDGSQFLNWATNYIDTHKYGAEVAKQQIIEALQRHYGGGDTMDNLISMIQSAYQ